MEGHRRSRKVKEGHGWSLPITGLTFQVRKVMVGGGVVCWIILPAPVPVPFLWTLDLGLDLGLTILNYFYKNSSRSSDIFFLLRLDTVDLRKLFLSWTFLSLNFVFFFFFFQLSFIISLSSLVNWNGLDILLLHQLD